MQVSHVVLVSFGMLTLKLYYQITSSPSLGIQPT